MKKFFKVLFQSKNSRARVGEIITDHGVIKTPAFVAVATKGTIKSLLPNLLKEIGIQVAFVNTYHLVDHPGVEVIEKGGGIHQYSKLDIPLMSDSGGFQIFSLAKDKNKRKVNIGGEEESLLLKISDDKVVFRSLFDGRLVEFSPEKSVEYQAKIGADINMAFDECISYGVDYRYTKKATLRTHHWLERSVKEFNKQQSKRKNRQFLYGIIQGGMFEDLRKKSARFVINQPVAGVAIGGVAVGEPKKQMRQQVEWVSSFLPKERPVHLLGVGHFDDILDLVAYGIDTFDCVEPTRLARMGKIYIQNSKFKIQKSKILIETVDIQKSVYKDNLEPVDLYCQCFVCKNFTKSYLYHLFKQRELLGYTLATYHNLYFIEDFFKTIREMIEKSEV